MQVWLVQFWKEQAQLVSERFSLEGFEQWLRRRSERAPVGWPCPCCSPLVAYLASLGVIEPYVLGDRLFFDGWDSLDEEEGEGEPGMVLPAWVKEFDRLFCRAVWEGRWLGRQLALGVLEQVKVLGGTSGWGPDAEHRA